MSAIQAVLALIALGIVLFLSLLVRNLVVDVRYAIASADWPDGMHFDR
jgi:hypothetical protein